MALMRSTATACVSEMTIQIEDQINTIEKSSKPKEQHAGRKLRSMLVTPIRFATLCVPDRLVCDVVAASGKDNYRGSPVSPAAKTIT